MPKALITSGNTRVAYAICQSLHSAGFEVYIGDKRSFTMAGMSRYCKGRMIYPSPFTQQEKFIEAISTFYKENNIDVLVPVLEETFTCLKYQDILLESGINFLLPTYDKALQLHAKASLTELANELKIDTPPTWELEDVLSSKETLENLPFPVILKPKQGGGGWGMQRFASATELYDFTYNEVEERKNYIIQKVIDGELIGACGIFYKGKHLVSDSYALTSAYPLRVGQSTTRLTKLYPSALDALKKLLTHIEWNGVCQMDFIYEPSTKKSYLIDANPRFWGSVKHNIAAGVDYPYYYALLAQGITDFKIEEAKMQTKTRWLGGDILRILSECKESNNSFICLPKVFFAPAHYHANDDWNIKDPLPFITWGINLIINRVLKRKKDALPGIWK